MYSDLGDDYQNIGLLGVLSSKDFETAASLIFDHYQAAGSGNATYAGPHCSRLESSVTPDHECSRLLHASPTKRGVGGTWALAH